MSSTSGADDKSVGSYAMIDMYVGEWVSEGYVVECYG